MEARTLRITTSWKMREPIRSRASALPDKTYQLSPTDTADAVVCMMLDQFRNEISALDLVLPASTNALSIYDAVSLASIVEKGIQR